MEDDADIADKVRDYEKRAAQLVENANGLVKNHELEKAGEFYWGAIGCYLNALELLYTGKAHAGHSEMVIEAKKIAAGRGDARLLDAVKGAEKLHANYYHSIIPEDEFSDYYEKAKYAILTFEGILKEGLSRAPKPSPDS